MPDAISLDALNVASAERFADALQGVFEHAPWVATRAVAQRPFPTVTALHEALLQQVRQAPAAERLAFLNGHPELAGAAPDTGLTPESRSEQARLGMAGTEGAAGLAALNRAYRERFGFPFIVCAARHTAANVLRVLHDRLGHATEAELDAAMAEVGHITWLRLAQRVDGPGAAHGGGALSSHVLDTAAGRPAAGLAVELLQEGVSVARATTDDDGRVGAGLLPPGPLRMGRYEFLFQAGPYFAARHLPSFYETISVRFVIGDAVGHFHVPLLLAPFGYSTYRGS